MSKKLGSLFLALLILGVLGGILPTSYANRSAIQRLNVQRLPKPNGRRGENQQSRRCAA